jgi:hypothetical protein
VDLTGLVPAHDRAVRVVSNLRVHWDQAFFAVESPAATPMPRRIGLASAELRYRGFSTPVAQARPSQTEDFDYGRLLEPAPWNAAAGRYTRYGDVAALLAAAPGWRRQLVLHLSGWAKDNEPNTRTHTSAEPFPSRAMRRYPPPDPDTAERRAWIDQWQTRRVPLLVPPLAPVAVLAESGR